MREFIDKIGQRGERPDSLKDHIDHITILAAGFRRETLRLGRRLRMRERTRMLRRGLHTTEYVRVKWCANYSSSGKGSPLPRYLNLTSTQHLAS